MEVTDTQIMSSGPPSAKSDRSCAGIKNDDRGAGATAPSSTSGTAPGDAATAGTRSGVQGLESAQVQGLESALDFISRKSSVTL